MSSILAIDPGPDNSGTCVFDKGNVLQCCQDSSNEHVLELCTMNVDALAIEMIHSQGMIVGQETFGTCVWIGRFVQQWLQAHGDSRPYNLIYRRDIKLHICGDSRAKDANIRQALIDLLGKPGTKKKPGPTYGVTSHAWSALAVAVCAEHLLATRAEHTPPLGGAS